MVSWYRSVNRAERSGLSRRSDMTGVPFLWRPRGCRLFLANGQAASRDIRQRPQQQLNLVRAVVIVRAEAQPARTLVDHDTSLAAAAHQLARRHVRHLDGHDAGCFTLAPAAEHLPAQ